MTKSNHIFALDFDGVICDSARETALTAWKAAAGIRDDIIDGVPNEEFITSFGKVRPVLHAGYEALLLACLLCDGISTDEILAAPRENLNYAFEATGRSESDLVEIFGNTRDNWIKNDFEGWIGYHRFYPEAFNGLQSALSQYPVYILTTKQERFVKHLLQSASLDFPENRIYGFETNRSKDVILDELRGNEAFASPVIHFVEDRLPTLRKCIEKTGMDSIRYYFALWGYNTQADQEAVRKTHEILAITEPDFAQLLATPENFCSV